VEKDVGAANVAPPRRHYGTLLLSSFLHSTWIDVNVTVFRVQGKLLTLAANSTQLASHIQDTETFVQSDEQMERLFGAAGGLMQSL